MRRPIRDMAKKFEQYIARLAQHARGDEFNEPLDENEVAKVTAIFSAALDLHEGNINIPEATNRLRLLK